jgi:hypothetical protein
MRWYPESVGSCSRVQVNMSRVSLLGATTNIPDYDATSSNIQVILTMNFATAFSLSFIPVGLVLLCRYVTTPMVQ